jgi:hypothetical protein
MADAGALISLAGQYAQRYGRASIADLRTLARRYGRIANPVRLEAVSPISLRDATSEVCALAVQQDRPTKEFTVPDLARMRQTISSLHHAAQDIVAHYSALPQADSPVDAISAEATVDDMQELAELIDDASRLEIERRAMPLAEWIRQKARKDLLSMSEHALHRHLDDLDRIRSDEWIEEALPAPESPGRWAREFESEYRQLTNDIDVALHIGRLLQEDFSGELAEADAEAVLLAKMTAFERGQFEVRKDNARKRQESRRRRPELFTDAPRRR